MNITVHKEDLSDERVQGYCCVEANIYVDSGFGPHAQREIVIHEVLEAYFPTLAHEMIEELAASLTDALDALNEGV